MAHKKARGRKPWKARYESYKTLGKYSKNKKAKIEAHLKLHPEDEQAQKALGKIATYKRKASGNSAGLSSVEKTYQQAKAKARRAMNRILYENKAYPKDTNDMEAIIMATRRLEDWPAALRKKYRPSKVEKAVAQAEAAAATA